MSTPTFNSTARRCARFIGGNQKDASAVEILDAIQDALRDVVDGYHWKCLECRYLLTQVAPVAMTLSFDLTGGSSERLWTVTSGTVPSGWAAYGNIRVGNNEWPVSRYLSSTTFQSPVENSPSADIASTSATLYRSQYTLRPEFLRAGSLNPESAATAFASSYDTIQALRRLWNTTGTPSQWTIVRDRHIPGRWAIETYPYESTAGEVLEFPAYRRPRALKYTGFANRDRVGTISISAGSTTVTGSGTAFESGMEGAMLFVSANGVDYPTGDTGANPAVLELVIDQVVSATSATVLSNSSTTAYTNVKYMVSDPIDLPDTMYNAFQRCCEYHVEINRKRDQQGRNQARELYNDALADAHYADSKLQYQPESFMDYVPSLAELDFFRAVGDTIS